MRRWLVVILIIVLGVVGLILYDGYRMQQTLTGQSGASGLVSGFETEKTNDETSDGRWFARQDVEQKNWTTDGLTRVGQYLPAVKASEKTVIVVPDDTRFGSTLTYPLIRLYHEQLGYNVFVPARQGIAPSTGTLNYGWIDRLDLINWTNQLIEETGTQHVLYHGVGVGGATALLAAGETTVPKQVKVVIAEGSYARLDDWFHALAKANLSYPAGPSLAAASIFNKMQQDFFYGDVSVTRQTSQIRIPALFIHGTDDTIVPSRMVYELYQAKPGIKQLYPVRGAGHGETYSTNPENYEKRLRLFVQPFLEAP
ncbi:MULTISPECIES: alpha/beta hydrolase [Exiguobacterium]|uniref:Alpha/beta hydrolase n=1 Tax=Exiguobacterium antarcticum TaxID=132920 RepID=A0ABT6R3S4_9BACL|nr:MULTISPECIES: alpha/beta hydrolase [Exiguobacterium]MCT4779990.1 alpha/beta hydrolase [Exiguobacterium soli]MDI3235458.1 alpha/beta hydrolase [Exiguobacterium antarcticum]